MLREYCLADLDLINHCKILAAKTDDFSEEQHFAMQYLPDRIMVVLGASNTETGSVFSEYCEVDEIPVIKRPSGGEAVLISPGTILFSHCMVARMLPKSSSYFQQNLASVQSTLEDLGVRNLRFNGVSDLCIGNRKILGCAIYRRPGMVLFQAVLNVELEPHIIARYLKHPSRMPDYRQNRPHSEFVTSLKAEGYDLPLERIDILQTLQGQGITLSKLPSVTF